MGEEHLDRLLTKTMFDQPKIYFTKGEAGNLYWIEGGGEECEAFLAFAVSVPLKLHQSCSGVTAIQFARPTDEVFVKLRWHEYMRERESFWLAETWCYSDIFDTDYDETLTEEFELEELYGHKLSRFLP